MIRLTDEEMGSIGCEFQRCVEETGETGQLIRATAKAQLKKVVEDWKSRQVMGEAGCIYISYTDEEWQALKKEAGL